MRPAPGDDYDVRRASATAPEGDGEEAQALFDEIVRSAALICDMPAAVLTLTAGERSRCLASTGVPPDVELPPCAASDSGELWADVLPGPHARIRFCAAAPLLGRLGEAIGTLRVMDFEPRRLDARQCELLRRQARLAARALELRGDHRLYEATPAMMHSVDMAGRIVAVSDAWLAATGYARTQVIGRPANDFLTAESAERARTVLVPALHAAGRCEDVELQMIDASGEVIDVRVSSILERDLAGNGLRTLTVVEDVRPRRRAERALDEKSERLGAVIDATKIGTWQCNMQTEVVEINEHLARQIGYTCAELGPLTQSRWSEFFHPDDAPRGRELLRLHLCGSSDGFEYTVRMRHRDGSWVWVTTRGRVMSWTADGRPEWMFGTHEDITQRKLRDEQLRDANERVGEQHELLRVTLASIGEAVITTDAHGVITWLNPEAERLTGWSSAQAAGEPVGNVFRTVDDDTVEPAAAGQTYHRLISRDTKAYGIEASRAPIVSARGVVLGTVLVFRDVTEALRLSGEVRYRAAHDGLTGLLNRAEFEQRLRRFLQAASERSEGHAMLYIDLDEFKLVNDACGHRAGDDVLFGVAQLLQQAVRAGDTLARLGGDEFAIILEHCSVVQGQRVAQQICDRMNDFRFVHEDRRFRIGASIGLVPIDGRWQSSAAILQAADAACYTAKEGGRNRVHTWIETDHAIHARHAEMQWTMRIERALDDDLFVLFAQRIEPRTSVPSGVHAEVLLRMRDNDGSLIPPGAFLPAAERYHLAGRIDRCVIGKAIAWLAGVPDGAIEMLAVNLSGQSVGDPAFHRWAYERLAAAGPRVCSHLCFEVTETAAITNLAGAITFIERVRAAGVRMALDDFGAGASSFGYLKSMPVDVLKIDGQFIANVVSDRVDALTVGCFADIARVMGIKTVAEHVDGPEVLALLDAIGIDFAQGFHLHRPAPIEELLLVPRSAEVGRG